MPELPGRTRVVLAIAALVAAFAAWQGIAVGAVGDLSASIDGVSSTSSPPGGVMAAEVTGTVESGAWSSTRWTIGPFAPSPAGGATTGCYNHSTYTSGEHTVNFTKDGKNTVTAPRAPGVKKVSFQAYADDDCTVLQGGIILNQGVSVTEPAPNPNLPPRCGIDVMLVLDESGSINTSGQTETVKRATRAFLNALSGTGAAVSIVDFSSTAARPVKYNTVTGGVNPDGTNATGSIGAVFEPYLKNQYKPNGWTNWEAAFHEVYLANTQGILADLVVFITDGDPTAHSGPPGNPTLGLTEGDVEAMRRAATEADNVKGQGSKEQRPHIFALGVGAAVTKPASADRLTAISGFDEYKIGGDFSTGDYTLVQDFDDLAQALRQIAIELCQASVSVTKLVDEGDGVYRSDPGWRFTADVSMSAGSYMWLQPEPPPATGPVSQLTKKDGVATFQWNPDNANATSTVALTEELNPGYEFVDIVCTTSAPGRTRRRTVRGTTPQMQVPPIGPNEYARCTVRNRVRPGTIEIEKSANPQGSQAFQFTGSLGAFTLVDQRANQRTTAQTFTGLAPGQYTVREIVPEDWELTSVACSDPAVVIAGPQVTINLAPGDAVVCTYRDTRIDPPVPPEQPDQPPDPLTPSGQPEPPTPAPTAPSTQIRVLKSAPAVARVGQRAAFALTVRNVGSVAAQNVIMADVPPAALTLARLQSTGGARVRLARGNAYWHLGTLAPGARRTIRGTVLIEAGSPGLKRNLVLATAVNAQMARDNADTRVLAQRRVIPPVTG